LNGAPMTGANPPAIGTIQIITGTTAICNATGTGLGGSASARSFVVLYVAESGTASGKILKCQGS
jgi:hypothetical protein